jgi:hypothetical protein
MDDMRDKRSRRRKHAKLQPARRQQKTVRRVALKADFAKQLGPWLGFACRLSRLVIQWIYLFRHER